MEPQRGTMRRNSTGRVLGAVGLALSAMMALAVPAAAQYGDDPSVQARVADVTPDQAAPATPVVFTTDAVFAPGATVQLFLVRALQGATPTPVGPVAVNVNGSVVATFTVPAGTEPGIYFVYATGTGEDGDELRVVGVLVVRAGASAASFTSPADGGGAAPDPAPAADGAPTGGGSSPPGAELGTGGEGGGDPATAPSAGSIATPPEIQAIQYPADVEQVLYDEAVASGEPVTVDADGLVLAGGRGDAGDAAAAGDNTESTPVAAALVAGAFVAGGLVVLRRRQQHTS